jgi:hypothetical protein
LQNCERDLEATIMKGFQHALAGKFDFASVC